MPGAMLMRSISSRGDSAASMPITSVSATPMTKRYAPETPANRAVRTRVTLLEFFGGFLSRQYVNEVLKSSGSGRPQSTASLRWDMPYLLAVADRAEMERCALERWENDRMIEVGEEVEIEAGEVEIRRRIAGL